MKGSSQEDTERYELGAFNPHDFPFSLRMPAHVCAFLTIRTGKNQ
jgi:hypothetical protein